MPTHQELKGVNTQVLLDPKSVTLSLNYLCLNTHKPKIVAAQLTSSYAKNMMEKLLVNNNELAARNYSLKGETLLYLDRIYSTLR